MSIAKIHRELQMLQRVTQPKVAKSNLNELLRQSEQAEAKLREDMTNEEHVQFTKERSREIIIQLQAEGLIK